MYIPFIKFEKTKLFFSSFKSFESLINRYYNVFFGEDGSDERLIHYLNGIMTSINEYKPIQCSNDINDFYKTTLTLVNSYGMLCERYMISFKELRKEYEEQESSLNKEIKERLGFFIVCSDFASGYLQIKFCMLTTLILEMRETAQKVQEAYEKFRSQFIVIRVLLKGPAVLENFEFPDYFEEDVKEVEDIVQEASTLWDEFCKKHLG